MREAILDAAADLVVKHGLLDVTMSQIAEAAGIGRATLYKYFPDVGAVLLAWHDRQITAHLRQLAVVRDHAADNSRLAAVLEAYALLSRHARGHQRSGFADVLPPGEHVARAQQQVHGMIRDLLAAGVEAGDVRADVPVDELATYCLHALGGAGSEWSTASVRRLVDVTLAGLRPNP